jgi:S-(hydroxymethyl)glutathione dehydrogenase/alcohol dehydrogenase
MVEAVGEDVTYVQPGDHVITCLSVFCGHCEFCLSGHMSICQTPGSSAGPPGKPSACAGRASTLNQFLNLSGLPSRCWCTNTRW